MGRNNDPVTLHKYAYGNLDPVNNIDPSGNFSLGGLMSAISVQGILTTASVAGSAFNLFSAATDEDGLTAKEVGITALILVAGPAAGKLVQLLARGKTAKVLGAAISSGALGKILIKGCKVSEVDLKRFVPPGTKNEFVSNDNIKAGFKYNFKVGDKKVQIKWHSPNKRDAVDFPDSSSGHMWTAQIRVGRKLLGSDGKLYRKASE